ncbi:MAG: phospholipid carrier-dependent glycosyltransferase [Caldilineaceae bacterium]
MSKFRVYGMTILIALLVAIYTMSSAGKFHIVDEVSLFAVTESLATRGEVDTNTIAWTQWVNSPGEVLGAFGPTGEVYSKKGPAPAFVAVPWYWTLRLFGLTDFTVGMLQSTLLWNGIVTALTAALLWLTAARLGYGERTGMALGLLFGLATIAWPYANHFFGEPLSAFSLLLTFYGILAWRRTRGLGWMVLAGVGAGLAITTVTAHTLLVGVLGLYAVAAWWFGDDAAGDDAARLNVATLVRDWSHLPRRCLSRVCCFCSTTSCASATRWTQAITSTAARASPRPSGKASGAWSSAHTGVSSGTRPSSSPVSSASCPSSAATGWRPRPSAR